MAFSAGHGGAARGQGTSDGGSGLSAESYRRRHEITVSVSLTNCLSETRYPSVLGGSTVFNLQFEIFPYPISSFLPYRQFSSLFPCI